MKKLFAGLVLALALSFSLSTAHAAGGGFKGQKFVSTYYYAFGGSASASGLSSSDARSIVDGDIMAIPAGTLIEKVYVIVDTAITGLSQMDIGDDDDQNGFVDSAAVTRSTPGLYSYTAAQAGAYLFANGTDSGGATYRHAAAKYYSAAGKEIKLDVAGTNLAGSFRVVVEGLKL